MNDMDERN